MSTLPSINDLRQIPEHSKKPAEHRKIAKLIAMPRKNNCSLMVGVSLHLPMKILDEVNARISGKSQSERLRTAILLGLEATKRVSLRNEG
jgi:hypothetical protein